MHQRIVRFVKYIKAFQHHRGKWLDVKTLHAHLGPQSFGEVVCRFFRCPGLYGFILKYQHQHTSRQQQEQYKAERYF